ncbi:ArsR family transcriptional regulator [Bacillus sp. LL01]|uniref:ArsR/SmtB family transcription factor n=1 Tax=Bacillus sp. LL01 TaxID=1665556 RepID=UPI00064D3DC0|nr:metalloregulator ArsR/SmtB family transcription factor [Bacillus sp. LL01]KMJ57276.1 ArsR family transcriptional regulator [Bacillus sp. LL01]
MKLLNITNRKRESYQVTFRYSLLMECALGIAAVTNTPLHDSLEKPKSYWDHTRNELSGELQALLDDVEKNNTWKTLLQLCHYHHCKDLHEFLSYIENLEDQQLKFLSLPYLGVEFQDMRIKASEGDRDACRTLMEKTKQHNFFPDYIQFICQSETDSLKSHLKAIMKEWYEEFEQQVEQETNEILKRDVAAKIEMQKKLTPEQLVEWATGGIEYRPEPNVQEVLLVPQQIYRPWNIEADMEGTKIFYYPVANESITPDDRYTPNHFLVAKYKALGDEARIRIVKHLSEKECTLQELTGLLDVGKSTIHHHLKILRAAKLVDSKDGIYTLRKHTLHLLEDEMQRYLHQ